MYLYMIENSWLNLVANNSQNNSQWWSHLMLGSFSIFYDKNTEVIAAQDRPENLLKFMYISGDSISD